jgi:hypothetical protein
MPCRRTAVRDARPRLKGAAASAPRRNDPLFFLSAERASLSCRFPIFWS